MKRLLIILTAVLVLAGCSSNGQSSPLGGERDIIYIDERFFMTQVDHLRLNSEQYVGKEIQFEGLFLGLRRGENPRYVVIRRAPGCCGDDGMVGFDVVQDGITSFPDNTWVQVTGILEELPQFNYILGVRATSVIEMEERGLEFVIR